MARTASHEPWTIEAIRRLGMTTEVETAAAILGIGRTNAYEVARWPIPRHDPPDRPPLRRPDASHPRPPWGITRAQNVSWSASVEGRELRFRGGQAALRYSLMTPPRTRFRRTGASIAMTTLGS